MGAQQIKTFDERLIERVVEQQQSLPLQTISNELISQQAATRVKAIMYNQSICTVSSPRQCITVANFAKMKVESHATFVAEETLGRSIKVENRTEKFIEASDENSITVSQELGGEFDTIAPKKEMLAAGHDVAQNTAFISLICETSAGRCENLQFPIQSEVEKGNQFIENLLNFGLADSTIDTSNSFLQETESDIFKANGFNPNITKLVKNPLAFLKKKRNTDRNQLESPNKTVKSEPTEAIGEELNAVTGKLKVESELQTIELNDLILKSEDLFIAENEETSKNANLYQTCLSYNSDSSLDVNLSQDSVTRLDLEEVISKQSPEDALSSISLDDTQQSLKYFTTIDVSSEEDHKSEIVIKSCKKRQTSYKKTINKEYTALGTKKRNFPHKQKSKRLSKRIKKDSEFKLKLSKRSVLKNLPKTAIKTRKNTKKPVAKRPIIASKAEFPRPLKLEIENSEKNQNMTVELPRPMKFKGEFRANSGNKQIYSAAAFQPVVRLKRLKTEELLVPLRTKHAGRPRKLKSVQASKCDFLIQNAYSLNPSIKFNRLSIDQYQSFHKEHQHSSNSRLPPNRRNDESVSEMEAKYYGPQERYTFCQSSITDDSSMFSGTIDDSGISTSTPSTSHRIHHNCNKKSLLLEIAAERAFINNHLRHFGHSPIQFDLYNDLNELNIFLKFLLGNLKAN